MTNVASPYGTLPPAADMASRKPISLPRLNASWSATPWAWSAKACTARLA